MAPLSDKRKAAAERKRKQRERLREDPEKYAMMKEKEKERSRKRREEKKIPSINDFSERGKRKQRAEWRKRYHKHAKNKLQQQRIENFVDEQSPPNSPSAATDLHIEPVFKNQRGNKNDSRKKDFEKRDKYMKKIKLLEKQLKHQKKKAEKWKKKHSRVVSKQESKVISENVAGNEMAIKSTQLQEPGNKKRIANSHNIKVLVQKFFIDDEHSFSTPGRKDTITTKKNLKAIKIPNGFHVGSSQKVCFYPGRQDFISTFLQTKTFLGS
ncbi:hypothetical protein J6590_037305 [Homalodisca vitripennis]|nr:hypothetical protein J6590_037305 [Homalodisca vitripennis]